MLRRVKIMALPLIIAAIFMVLSFPGCGGNGAGSEETVVGELTEQELKDVLADSLLATANADTYAFSMDMDMDIEVKGGSEAGKMEISMKADVVANMADEEM